MANPFVKAWKYLMALFSSKVDEYADPKVQIQQAIEDAQRQHQALTQQAAQVIGNQRQLEMRLNRQLADIEKLQANVRQALTLADQATAAGDAAKATEYTNAAEAFAGCAHRWAESHLPASLDAAALAQLAGKVIEAASPAGAPLFAAWRAMPEPDGDAALALHRMNVLRELRGGLHGCSVLAAGIAPQVAVEVRTPYMSQLFGWPEPGDASSHQGTWDAAESATDQAMAAAFAGLDEATEAVTAESTGGEQ